MFECFSNTSFQNLQRMKMLNEKSIPVKMHLPATPLEAHGTICMKLQEVVNDLVVRSATCRKDGERERQRARREGGRETERQRTGSLSPAERKRERGRERRREGEREREREKERERARGRQRGREGDRE